MTESSRPHPTTLKTYAARASLHPNPTARRLLEIMHRKQTNLCVSVDVTTVAEVLEIVKSVGGEVCMVKVGPGISRQADIFCIPLRARISLQSLICGPLNYEE